VASAARTPARAAAARARTRSAAVPGHGADDRARPDLVIAGAHRQRRRRPGADDRRRPVLRRRARASTKARAGSA
jgi:hypothetical protein